MAWCNSYASRAPKPKAEGSSGDMFGPDPYDINFCFPVNLAALENERVALVPFIPKLHAEPYYKHLAANPDIYRYLPFAPPKSVEEVCEFFEDKFRRSPGCVAFALIDKTRPASEHDVHSPVGGCFAGTLGLIYTSAQNLMTEIALVIVFPEYRRSHVLSNASGLLIQYCLNLPTDAKPGLGLRRVQWMANTRNERSIKAAERFGLKHEATLRWNWVLPEGKEGSEPREGDPAGTPGRDSVILALCWDDWTSGAKEKLNAVMQRTS